MKQNGADSNAHAQIRDRLDKINDIDNCKVIVGGQIMVYLILKLLKIDANIGE